MDRCLVYACYGHPKTSSDVVLRMVTTKLTVRTRSARPPSHTSCWIGSVRRMIPTP